MAVRPGRKTQSEIAQDGKEAVTIVKSAIDEMLEELIPENGKKKPLFYPVQMGKRVALFRFPKNISDILGVRTGVSEFVERIHSEQAEFLQPNSKVFPMEPYAKAYRFRELNKTDIAYAYILCYWSSQDQPGGKITESQALQLVAADPYTVCQMVDDIESVLSAGHYHFMFDGVDEKKESLAPTITGT